MQTRNVPLTGPRYWIALSAASVFGVNMGDYVARIMHLGHWMGLPILLGVFAAILLAERNWRHGTEAFYWSAVVIERTAATNIADILTHDFDLNYGLVLAGLAAVLIGVIAPGGVVPPHSRVQRMDEATREGRVANPRYWLAMLAAEVLGTVFSDAFSDWLDLPFAAELSILLAMFAIIFGLRSHDRFVNRLTYWLGVLVVATCGPTAGDWLAHSGHLRLATLITGAAFVLLLVIWKKDRQPASSSEPMSAGAR